MNVVITGGAGFLGLRLAREILRRGVLSGPDGAPRAVTRVTLLDITAPAQTISDPRVVVEIGDISERALLERAIGTDTQSVFHLAAIVSGMAEAEFDLGMRVNLDATRALLEVCRATGERQRVVFTSSVAVFGGTLPDVVRDDTAVTPQTSYGAEKAMGELMVSDYSRKGFVDGRVLRLPTVSVRPGRPNAAASSFASGIIREPLNGEAANCPVEPSTRMWVISPSTVIACLIKGHDLPGDAFGASRVVNLPGLTVTAREMVDALARVAGKDVAGRVTWNVDPRIARMVATWPGAIDNTRALALGFPHDTDFESIVRQHVNAETIPPATRPSA
jgi:nucleoside-diphosphate-sugar epimerase